MKVEKQVRVACSLSLSLGYGCELHARANFVDAEIACLCHL